MFKIGPEIPTMRLIADANSKITWFTPFLLSLC